MFQWGESPHQYFATSWKTLLSFSLTSIDGSNELSLSLSHPDRKGDSEWKAEAERVLDEQEEVISRKKRKKEKERK